MNLKQLLALGLLGALIVGMIGCKKETTYPENAINASLEKTINNHRYKLGGNTVTEITVDNDNKATYGIISDAHGEGEKAKYFAMEFQKRGVDGIILTGDEAKNEGLRYGRKDSIDDALEIQNVLEAVAQTGLPVFAIPGNHERKSDWEIAVRQASSKYNNIIDMTKYRIVDGDDVDFVSLPGYQTNKIPGRQFIPDDGFWAMPDMIKETGKLRAGLDDAVVLITHGCGKTGSPGPATTYSGQDVGDALTTTMMRENHIPFAVCGHIHEAGGLAATYDGKLVKQGEWATQFSANFGGLEEWKHLNGKTYQGMAGILTIEGDNGKFEMMYGE